MRTNTAIPPLFPFLYSSFPLKDRSILFFYYPEVKMNNLQITFPQTAGNWDSHLTSAFSTTYVAHQYDDEFANMPQNHEELPLDIHSRPTFPAEPSPLSILGQDDYSFRYSKRSVTARRHMKKPLNSYMAFRCKFDIVPARIR
jgi:hypothetical protein